jgi:hypothetical protein
MAKAGERAAAKKLGLKRYFNGRPCSLGHIAERYVAGSGCVECLGVTKRWPRTKEYNNAVAKAYNLRPKGAAYLLWKHARRGPRQPVPFSITRGYVLDLLMKAVAAGTVVLDKGGPMQASIDRKIPALGYVEGNIQIVPAWWNYAKHDWSEDELRNAMSAAGWQRLNS